MTKVANTPTAPGAVKTPNRGGVNRGGARQVNQRRPKRPFQEKVMTAIPAVDWTKVELKEFRKSFVDTTKTPAKKYTETAVAKIYAEAEARATGPLVAGSTTPPPIDSLKAPYSTLKETPFPAALQNELIKQGVTKPLPLQSICWPYIMSGKNFVGTCPSGNEKMLTYVLPAIVHVHDQVEKAKLEPVVEGEAKPEDNGPLAVILTNVKKRGEQIFECVKTYQAALNVTSHLIFGSTDKKKEGETDTMADAMTENPNILVVVIGLKFSYMLLAKTINLNRCTFLVMDDAGRIAKNVRLLENVLGQVRNDRHLIMWTVSYGSNNNAQDAVRHTAKFAFDDYVRLDFGAFSQFYNPSAVKQLIDPVEAGDRDKRFIFLVQTVLAAASVSTKKPKLLVFCSSAARMKKVGEVLLQTGLLSKTFNTKNPIVAPVAEPAKEVKKEATAEKDAAAAPAAAEPAVEAAEPMVVEEEAVDETPQAELNELALRENPMYNIWIANDSIPLDELDFSHFDFVINYDFPAANCELYEQRVVKYKAEGKGTIFSYILDAKTAKYISGYMLDTHQYVPPKLIDDKKNQSGPAANAQNKGAIGKPVANRPPSLLQKNMRNGMPFIPGGRGNFNPNFNNSGGRFGGQKFNDNFQSFGGNRGGFNRNGGGGMGGMGGGPMGGGGGGGRNFGGGPGVLDALQILNQLRNQGGNNSFDNDNYRNSNDFSSSSRSNFGGMNNGGGGGGGSWFKDDMSGGRFNSNFNNRNNF